MDIELAQKPFPGGPAPSGAGIHHLDIAAATVPDDHKVSQTTVLDNHGDGWHGPGLREQYMVNRHHDLFRFKAELVGKIFHGVDGGPVHIGLACLPETAIVCIDAKSLKQ